MNTSDKTTLFKSISADFKIITRKTKLWDLDYCERILHDVEKYLENDYLSCIYLIMKDVNNLPIRVNKYNINYNKSNDTNERPGNNDWDNLGGTKLLIQISYEDNWQNMLDIDKE